MWITTDNYSSEKNATPLAQHDLLVSNLSAEGAYSS